MKKMQIFQIKLRQSRTVQELQYAGIVQLKAVSSEHMCSYISISNH